MGSNKHPMKVAMVSILVDDPIKAFQFYTEILGFEKVMYQPEHFLAIVQSPSEGDDTHILLEPTGPGGYKEVVDFKKKINSLGLPVIIFSSDDIEKTVEELKSKGVKFTKDITKTDYGHEAIFDDTNGNFIQIIQMNEKGKWD